LQLVERAFSLSQQLGERRARSGGWWLLRRVVRDQHGMHDLLEMAMRQTRGGIAKGDDFALLGKANAAIVTAGGHGQNSLIGTGAAAAIKQSKVNPIAARPAAAVEKTKAVPRL